MYQGGLESVDVALTLLAEQGFDATTMTQIAEATGIPADDVVRILGTKDSIVLAVARECSSPSSTPWPNPTRKRRWSMR